MARSMGRGVVERDGETSRGVGLEVGRKRKRKMGEKGTEGQARPVREIEKGRGQYEKGCGIKWRGGRGDAGRGGTRRIMVAKGHVGEGKGHGEDGRVTRVERNLNVAVRILFMMDS